MLATPGIRLATSSDARAIAELSRDCIEQGLGWNWTQARVMRSIHDRSTNVAVIHERAALLGFGIMEYAENTAHLVLLGVQPTRQRRGLGRALLAWLEVCAVTAGIARIRAEARSDNPQAIGFYHRQGFSVKGTIPGYYRGIVDGIRLEKQLRKEPPP